MTDTNTVVAVGGFLLDVFLKAHANAEARHTGRPRQARGPEFDEVLKQAGGSPSLLDLRATLGKFGGTATAADAGSAKPPPPTPTPPPSTAAPENVASNLEAELATVFAEADAARARLEEARRADEHMQMLVELRQFMGEKLGALERGLSDLNARLMCLEAVKPQQTAAPASVTAASGEAARALVGHPELDSVLARGFEAAMSQASDRLTVLEGST